MKRFNDELISREMKGGYYQGIKLGQDVTLQKIDSSMGPRLKLKRIYSGIQKKERKLGKIIRMIENENKTDEIT